MTQAWAHGTAHVDTLRVSGLSVGHGELRVLSELNFACERGELCAIVGVNGAGKSSLLSVLAGVHAAQSGEVRLGQMKITRGGGKPLAKRRAYMEQGEAPGFDYTVSEIVMMGEYAWRSGWGPDGEQAHERARVYLEEVGLGEYGGRSVMHLSGGERRRVMLARVMATRAGWWLLDEPLASLDLKVQGVVMDVVRAHCDAGGGAVIVCHDLNWVMARCQRVVVCHEGVLWADGRPEDVLTHEAIHEVFGVDVKGVGEGEHRRWIHQV